VVLLAWVMMALLFRFVWELRVNANQFLSAILSRIKGLVRGRDPEGERGVKPRPALPRSCLVLNNIHIGAPFHQLVTCDFRHGALLDLRFQLDDEAHRTLRHLRWRSGPAHFLRKPRVRLVPRPPIEE